MTTKNPLITILFVGGLILLGTFIIPSVAHDSKDDDDHDGQLSSDRVKRGLALAPVPLDLRHTNKALVGLGSYIVNAQGGCNDCHTCPSYLPGNDPFMGQPEKINSAHYLGGGRRFGPPNDPNAPVSANLTPDAKTGLPGGHTFEDFKKIIRTGVDHETGRILQVMPWPAYGKMTDRDLRAIYEYLRAIPHAEPGCL